MKAARQQWLDASHFHPHTDEEVLAEVLSRTEKVSQPVAILDLDSTLYEVGPRTHQILLDWIETHPEKNYPPELANPIRALRPEQIGYSLKDTFEAAGLNLKEAQTQIAWRDAKAFWRARFFSNPYLKYDQPYPGAVVFVQALYEKGSHLVYLTGRDEPGMGEGTRFALERDGFPVGSRTSFILKESREVDDLYHKQKAAKLIQSLGETVASFENEPKNLIALQAVFPQAMHILMQTLCSDHPAPIGQNLYRIRSFKKDD